MTKMRVHAVGEHHDEPVHGLPGALPEGEHILWQGAPDWRLLAVEAFHWRKLAVYFALLVGWAIVSALADGAGPAQLARAVAGPLLLSAGGLGLVFGLAWMSARTTVYTLTNRRIGLRIGIVLTVTYNLPLKRIAGASLHPLAGGHGDIALQLEPSARIGWLHLWPHVRPWQLRRTQPMMRALPEVQAVGAQLMAAWQACQPVADTVPVGATESTVQPGRAANDARHEPGSGLRPAAA